MIIFHGEFKFLISEYLSSIPPNIGNKNESPNFFKHDFVLRKSYIGIE